MTSQQQRKNFAKLNTHNASWGERFAGGSNSKALFHAFEYDNPTLR
jgi:hypothetical protein